MKLKRQRHLKSAKSPTRKLLGSVPWEVSMTHISRLLSAKEDELGYKLQDGEFLL